VGRDRNQEPRHVLVQLASDDAPAPAAERLVDRVEALLRAAFPRARVTVILDHSIAADRVAVVAPDPDAQERTVRRLIDEARADPSGKPDDERDDVAS
jgi:hypothetical protein